MTRRTLELAAFCIALIVAAMAVHAWLASRDEQRRLAATLAAQKQIIDSANANERANQSSLADTLAQIEKLKRDTQTPAQILAALPKYLQLPQPITLAQSPQPQQGSDNPTRIVIPSDQRERGISLPGAHSSENHRQDAGAMTPSHPAATPRTSSGCDAANVATPPGGSAHVECGSSPPLSTTGASSGASSRVEGQGFLALSEVEGSPDTTTRAQRDTSLPKAVAQAAGPQRQGSSSSAPCASAADCPAQIPSADLKPLFDYVQDCRACQAQLAAAQKNSADDAAKIAALTRERDAAVTAAKGGSFLRRLRRNALWFAIGAAGGYIASKR